MTNAVKETACTHCVHRGVCKHQKDFLDVIDVTWSEGNKGCIKRVTNFECVEGIEVTCKFYQREIAQPREGIF